MNRKLDRNDWCLQAEMELFGEDSRADLEYWSKMDWWTIDEATALAKGQNPKIVNWDFLKKYPKHAIAVDFDRRRELALRAEGLQDRNEPARFIAWAKSIGLE